ncbi:MAG: endonuclease, partial [Candidatus Krumholzibacteria bacterium]|nr:endonuclease [Candidatus Krumholzibacteria bacterium]
VDEIYVGVNRQGTHFVVPVQAKAGSDQLGGVQTAQDIACCKEKFPSLVCRAVAAQFLKNEMIALFELTIENHEIQVVQERHYQLVPSDKITDSDLTRYRETE